MVKLRNPWNINDLANLARELHYIQCNPQNRPKLEATVMSKFCHNLEVCIRDYIALNVDRLLFPTIFVVSQFAFVGFIIITR